MFSSPLRLAGCWLVAALAFHHSGRAAEIAPGTAARTGLKGPASDEPRRAMERFRLQPEFKVELFAAEPLLANPIALSIDNLGRCFVAEAHRDRSSALDGRNYTVLLEDDLAARTVADREAMSKKHFPNDWQKLGVETEVIRLVEDRDRDGVADQSAIFADGFATPFDGMAGGVLARDGQVWFANIPNLWRLEGPDENGRAMKREVLSTGYGVRFGIGAHGLRGPIRGPDGRLYFAIGDCGANVKTKEGATLTVPDEGAVFRCEPDGTHLEIFCRGLRDPCGLAFDNFGNLFTVDGASGASDGARWEYLVEDGDYGWRIGWQHPPLGEARNPWLAEKMWTPQFEGQAAWLLPPIAIMAGESAGLVHYSGTGFSPRYDDHFFICELGGDHGPGISSRVMKQQGAYFMALDEHVLVGNCRATAVGFGPDSKLYFTESGEGAERTGRGRIFRVHDERSILEARVGEVQQSLADGLKSRSPVEVRDFLKHTDQRIRLEAEWALAALPDGEFFLRDTALAPAGGSEPQLARLHGIWGLGIIARRAAYATSGAGAKVVEPLVPLLEDDDPEVRAQAALVLGEQRVEAAFDGLIKMLRSPDERVSFFAAQALARLRRAEMLPQLRLMIREAGAHDPFLRHAYVSALVGLNDFAAIEQMAGDESPEIRMVALLALRRLRRAEIATLLHDDDPMLVIEAARAINDEGIASALPPLAALIAQPSANEPLMLRVLNANFRVGTPATAEALAIYAASGTASASLRVEALQLLAQWPQPPPRDRITGLSRPLPARDAAPAATALRAALPKLRADASETVAKAAAEAAAVLRL